MHPLGLAAKGQVWYLVADTEAGLRTFRVDRVTDLEPLGEPVVRPEGFDLAEAWRMITAEVDERRAAVWARGTADAGGRAAHADDVRQPRAHRPDRRRRPGRGRGRLGRASSRLAGQLAGLGGQVVLSEPPEVIARLAAIARELTELYGSSAQPGAGNA